ncbi:nitrite reductase, copper-dependent [Capnocytophaga sp. oral taxon 863 str. F0517]|uniref:copper-containing nitrite reductase n=1 Tax=Capnocytophaga sp. oral taxon 863 TaxID=1227265 RepID=UPI000395E976|nr:copper-containing nitrite reductase [Capnocytophaga sp. oral taxon 863]ERI61844.1 nitrite reductase, copper-dependent [Capnocytophaga sp. oral taxon 863 str. F0517]
MKKYTTKLMTLVMTASLLGACGGGETEQKTTSIPATDIVAEGEQEMAELTSPPYVPKPVGTRAAKKLKVDLEIIEQEGEIMDGTKYLFWTFGGTVPGSFIRTRVGDEVEFTLKNHQDNKLPHNIDLHAVTGPGGGAAASLVAPGQQRTFSFKCLNPGLYVYHCAQAPVPLHIANGMYGLILVEPEGGLPPVDKEYYVMQGDFYTDGAYGAGGTQAFNQEKALKETPDYIVFNGKVGSLTQDGALTANPGETVRLFVGNGGPNMVSSFHVIGEIFDRVHVEGGSLLNENVQTTLIPAGGAAIVEFKVDVPGSYVLVDHSIFRAFNKGALGLLVANGEENRKIYAKNEAVPYVSDLKISTTPKDEAIMNKTKEQQIADGKGIYTKVCVACHQAQGQGMEGAFPPLAKSDFLNADVDRAIDIVLHGKQGEITVNGKKYNSVMTPQPLSVQEVADVLTYVYNTWDNSKKVVTPEMVQKIKK